MDGTGGPVLAQEDLVRQAAPVVPDAGIDPRFANNPFVTGEIALHPQWISVRGAAAEAATVLVGGGTTVVVTFPTAL